MDSEAIDIVPAAHARYSIAVYKGGAGPRLQSPPFATLVALEDTWPTGDQGGKHGQVP
jgi:hypothetical protein